MRIKIILAILFSIAVAACGGGGSTSSSNNNGGTISGKVTLSGTVASGAPWGGSVVSIRDKSGTKVSATTLADGTYSAEITNMTAPILIQVPNPAGGSLYSVATSATSGTVNVHPFTDMIVRNWYKVQGSNVDTAFAASGAMPTPPTATDIATIEAVVSQVLATYMRGANVNPASFNLITTPFNANHAGFDLVLDNLKVTQPATPGGNVTIGLAGGGSTGTILTVADTTSLATITPPPAPVSDTVAPSVPGVITSARISNTQVVLSWIAATDNIQVAGYKIFRNATQVGITDQPFYIDGAAPATNACYTVSAYDAAGNSSAENTQVCASAIAVAADTTAPTAPGTLTATVISSSQIDLAWTASTDNIALAGYRVMAGGAAIASLPATATTYSHTGLNANTQYSYTVVAIDTSGNQASATTGALTTVPPASPTGVSATAGDAQVAISWTAVTGATSYNIYRGTATGVTITNGTKVTGATSGTAITGLTNGTPYYFVVTAVNAGGESAVSSEVNATPNTIVGGWYLDCSASVGMAAGSNMCTFTFFANGEYVMTQDYVTIPPSTTLLPGGMERGTYSWNPATGAFRTLCPRVDTNGEAGISHPVPGICSGTTATVTVSGNTLTMNIPGNGIFTLNRLSDAANPAVGSWAVTSISSPSGLISSNLLELTIALPNGEYVQASSGPAVNGTDGIEHGTTTWNSVTGAFSTTCPTLDTNGSRGLSSIVTPACGVPASQGATMSVSGNLMTMTIPAVPLPLPLTGSATVTITSTRVTPPTSLPPAQTFTEYALPAGSRSLGIASGSDGNLWFTDEGTNSIGKMTPAGVVTLYAIPSTTAQPGMSGPQTIVAGPDGNLWFVEGNSNNIAKITTAGVITEYANTAGGWPQDLAVGPDGNIWFTDQGVTGGGNPAVNANGAIGMLNIATGAITKYPLLTANTLANWITRGPDGAMWFTQSGGSSNTARITTAGVITEFANTSANGITTGSDGNLWVTTPTGGVARLTTAGVMTPFAIPTTTNNAFFIVAAPDGNLWATEVGGSFATNTFTGVGMLGRVTTSGVVTEYTLPASSNSNPGYFTIGAMTVGADGALWFAETQSNKIGRFAP